MARTYRWMGGAALCALALAATANVRAQSCTSDDDCDEGYECDLGPMATLDCAPDAGTCDSTPEPRSGECEPAVMRCQTDADCVKGLKCELHGDSDDSDCASPVFVDGGAPADPTCMAEPAPEPTEGECVYELVECTKDSECDDGLECAPLGRASDCSGSGSPAPACMPGQECPEQPQPEETCTETTVSYCFPPPVDCDSNADCENDTRCVQLSEDAKEDPPPGWEGKAALCLPEAIALVLEGRVEASGGKSSSQSDSAAADKGGRAPTKSDGNATDEDNARDGGAGDKAKGQAKSDDCAVSAVGTGERGVAWLWLLGAPAFFLRRRRSAKR